MMNDNDAIAVGPPRSISNLVAALATDHGDPARMLELHYWAQEPGLLELIRELVALPEESRAVIEAFLASAPDKDLVSVTLDDFGRVTLSSPEVAETMSVFATSQAASQGLPKRLV